MRPTLSTGIWIISLGLILSGFGACDQIKVPNFQICADKAPLGAHCTNFYGDAGDVNLDRFTWTQKLAREHDYCISPSAWGNLKTSYEKVCTVCDCCTYETDSAMQNLQSKLSRKGK